MPGIFAKLLRDDRNRRPRRRVTLTKPSLEVCESRILLSGEPPPVIFDATFTAMERAGFYTWHVVQNPTFNAPLSDRHAWSQRVNLIQERPPGILDGDTQVNITGQDGKLRVEHGHYHYYANVGGGAPFFPSGFNSQVQVRAYVLGEPGTPYSIELNSETGTSRTEPSNGIFDVSAGANPSRLNMTGVSTSETVQYQGATYSLVSRANTGLGSHLGYSSWGGFYFLDEARAHAILDIEIENLSVTPQIEVQRVVDFGTEWIYHEQTQPITIRNVGTPGSVLEGEIGSVAAPFYVINGGSFSLEAGESYTVHTSFSPGPYDSGSHIDNIVITSNDIDDSQTSVTLRGIARGAEPWIRSHTTYASFEKPESLAFDYTVDSSSGEINDLRDVEHREILSVSPRFMPLPWSRIFNGPFESPMPLRFESGRAFFRDAHEPYRQFKLPKRLWSYFMGKQSAPVVTHQIYQWRAPWTNGQWRDTPNGRNDITRQIVSSDVEDNGVPLRVWRQRITKHGVSRSFNEHSAGI